MSQFHPNPNEVVPIPASEDRPRRISISGGNGTVYFGASVASAHKEVKLNEKDGLSVDLAQQAFLVTDANTVVVEGLKPIKPVDGVAEENFDDGDPKVHKAKEPSKKDAEDVAKRNEKSSIPSLTGEEEPEPSQPAAVKS